MFSPLTPSQQQNPQTVVATPKSLTITESRSRGKESHQECPVDVV